MEHSVYPRCTQHATMEANTMQETALLELRGICKFFPGVRALDGVDFTLCKGEIHALMGENGAGKSTLIKVLTGVYSRDAGTVNIEGVEGDVAIRSPQDAQAVGISRSAFYKYRDSIAPFQNLMAGRIITFQMMLKDKAGVLSEILAIFANCGANILTINQSIPTGGRAMVTISAETSNLSCTLEALTQKIAERKGVVKADCVAG